MDIYKEWWIENEAMLTITQANDGKKSKHPDMFDCSVITLKPDKFRLVLKNDLLVHSIVVSLGVISHYTNPKC